MAKTEEEMFDDFFFEPEGYVVAPDENVRMTDVPTEDSFDDFFFEEQPQEKPLQDMESGELKRDIAGGLKQFGSDVATGLMNAAETVVEFPAMVAVGLGTEVLKGYEGINSLLFRRKSLKETVQRMDSYNQYPENVRSFIRDKFLKAKPEFVDTPFDLTDTVYKGVGYVGEWHEGVTDYAGESGYLTGKGLGLSPELQALMGVTDKIAAEGVLGVFEAGVGKAAAVTGKVATETAVGTTKGAMKAGKAIAGGMKTVKEYRQKAIDNAVATAEENWIKQISDNKQVLEHIADSVELEKSIPGYKLDLADASGSEVLMMEKRNIMRGDTGAKQAAELRESNKLAISNEVNRVFGENPEAGFYELIETSDGTYKGIISNIDNEMLNVQRRLSRYQINYEQNGVLKYSEGKAIQNDLKRMFLLKKAKGNILWKGLEGVPIKVDGPIAKASEIVSTKNLWTEDEIPYVVRKLNEFGGDTSKQLADRIAELDAQITQYSSTTARMTDPEGSAAAVQQLMAEKEALKSAKTGVEMPLTELKDMYSDVNSTYIVEKNALKSAIDPSKHRQRIRHLADLKGKLEEALDAAELDPRLADNVKQYRAAKEFWKKEVAKPFQEGIAGDILIPGARKDFIMAGEDVIDAAFKNADVDEFAKFVKVAKQSDQLYGRLRDGIVRKYAEAVTKKVKLKDGNVISMIDPASHDKFMLQYAPLLKKAPEIYNQIKDINRSALNIQESLASIEMRKMRVQDSQLYKLVDSGDPRKFWNSIKSTDGAREILANAKATGVPKEAVERAAISLLYRNSTDISDTGPPVLKHKKMIETLHANDGLKIIIPIETQNRIINLARAGEKINYELKFDVKAESPSWAARLEDFTGRSWSMIVSNIRHMKQRIVSPTFVAQDLVMSTLATLNKGQVNKILSESMMRPDLQKVLEKAFMEQGKKGKVSQTTSISLYNKLYQYGMIGSMIYAGQSDKFRPSVINAELERIEKLKKERERAKQYFMR